MFKLWQFLEGHPKPAFSEKVQRGDQEKFFNNRLRSSPRFNGPTALWRKCHYPLNCKRSEVQRLIGSKSARMAKLVAILARSPKKRIS